MNTFLIALAIPVVLYFVIYRFFGDLLDPKRGERYRTPSNRDPRPPGQLIEFDPEPPKRKSRKRSHRRKHRDRR